MEEVGNLQKPKKSQFVFSAIAWSTIISVILFALGVRQKWVFVTIYTWLTFIAIFGKMDEHM